MAPLYNQDDECNREDPAVKQLFLQGPSVNTRLLLVSVLSVSLMVLDHRFHHADNLRSALSVLIYPFRYLMNVPSDVGGWATDTFRTRRGMQDELDTLRTQNELLRADLQRLTFLQTENLHLRSLLDSSKRIGQKVLIAEILTVDLDPYKRQLLLSKGERDGVYVGQPLIDARGIMGQVKTVTPFTSTALLITDPSHALPVMINRNGMRAIAEGTGQENRLSLPHIPNNADVQVGDLLLTSGLGCVFPAGYPVGEISEITTDPSLPFAQIIAKPSARLNHNREVLLVWPEQTHTASATGPNPCQQYQQAEQTP